MYFRRLVTSRFYAIAGDPYPYGKKFPGENGYKSDVDQYEKEYGTSEEISEGIVDKSLDKKTDEIGVDRVKTKNERKLAINNLLKIKNILTPDNYALILKAITGNRDSFAIADFNEFIENNIKALPRLNDLTNILLTTLTSSNASAHGVLESGDIEDRINTKEINIEDLLSGKDAIADKLRSAASLNRLPKYWVDAILNLLGSISTEDFEKNNITSKGFFLAVEELLDILDSDRYVTLTHEALNEIFNINLTKPVALRGEEEITDISDDQFTENFIKALKLAEEE